MTTQYRADIDGLRAVAVGGVVLFHAFPHGLTGGYIGVDVFFVLSGFLITSIIRAEAEAGKFSIAGFYERRFRRILPALLAMLIATTIGAIVILPPTELAAYGKSLAGVAVFASNIVFWRDSGYFDTASIDKPLLHTWSLAVEEQFYIVWPLIAAALVRFGKRRALGIFVWLAVIASLIASVIAIRVAPSQAFYLLPYRAWELGFGALLAVGAVPAFRSAVSREAAAWIGLALIVVPMAFYTEETPFPGLAAVPPCLGTLLLIHAGHGYSTRIGRALAWRPILYTGLISYSFYLWHWPILVLSRIALHGTLEIWQAALAVVVAFGMGALSLQFVEKPFRGRGTFTMTRGQVLSASAATLALFVAIGFGGWATDGLARYASPQVLAAEHAVRSVNPLRARCHSTERQETLAPLVACTRPATADGHYNVLLWGDSHADHLMPGLSRLGREEGFAVRQATVSGCSPVALFFEYGEHRASCPELYRAALAEAARQPDLRAVVISARWSNILLQVTKVLPAAQAGNDRRGAGEAVLARSVRQTLALVRSTIGPKPRIIIVGTTPEFDFWPAVCLARSAKIGNAGGPCSLATPSDVSEGPDADRVLAAIDGLPNVRFIFPRALFCKSRECATTADGKIFFRDDDHLTNDGSRMVANVLDAVLPDAQARQPTRIATPQTRIDRPPSCHAGARAGRRRGRRCPVVDNALPCNRLKPRFLLQRSEARVTGACLERSERNP